MTAYKLSRQAEEDVNSIFKYGVQHFGLINARSYLEQLEHYLNTLSEHRELGEPALELNPPGLRRFIYEAHIIFYIPVEDGIFVVRILSQRMDTNQHFQ